MKPQALAAKQLQITALDAFYGKSQILRGAALSVSAGEIVALLGRNGSGRSTLAKAAMGLVACTGSIVWNGHPLIGLQAHEIANLGVGYVPESRDVFPNLTVLQNLLLGQKRGPQHGQNLTAWSLDDTFAIFPVLKARLHTPAGVLSGGEQQMLTLCRTLMGNPDLLIVDEPTEGLAPLAAQQVAELLVRMRSRGLAVLLIEQKLTIAKAVSDRCVVLGHGRVVFEGTPQALLDDAAVCAEWLLV
jgi:branched-chain amino acid transport system ATP-binding protein